MTREKLLDDIRVSLQNYCDHEHKFTFDSKNPVVRLHEPTFGADEIFAAVQPMLSTFVTMGKKVRKFEEEYASKMGHKYAVMNNSGSSANLLAISALANPHTTNRLSPGDEVIVPALSWSTTLWPLIQNNLFPVIVDCDPNTWNFDLEKLEAAITPKTKAIMLVHVYGNPCDMDAIMALASKYKLQIIEDSCESMGAFYKDKAVGSFGRVGTFSFYFSHHITTLEGGICVTDDFELTETMRVLRAHGWSREADEHQKYVEKYPEIDPRFIFINIGYNLRPTECHAAMGSIQLPKLDGIVAKRRENAKELYKALSKYSSIFTFQQETKNAKSSWFGFGMIIRPDAPFNVAEITSFLHGKNIETRPIIAGNIAKHPALADYQHRLAGTTENSDNIMVNGFAIGCHHYICADARKYIINAIEEFLLSKGI
jgi:CDP-6-deoxy-D-xylo-4-hexulose-3-dehydrase